jgi:Nickel responsive protein SCO4226-like
MANMVLEQTFEKPITPEEMNAMAKRVDPCLEAHGATWVRSYVSSDRKRVICEFEAPDAEKVRESYRSAGVQFERVWSAEVFSRDKPSASY